MIRFSCLGSNLEPFNLESHIQTNSLPCPLLEVKHQWLWPENQSLSLFSSSSVCTVDGQQWPPISLPGIVCPGEEMNPCKVCITPAPPMMGTTSTPDPPGTGPPQNPSSIINSGSDLALFGSLTTYPFVVSVFSLR